MTIPGTSRLGIVTIEGDYADINFERRLAHPPEAVWEAITSPDQFSEWYWTKGRIEGWVGGKIEFWSGPLQLHVTGLVTAWDPPRLFEHEWNVDPRAEFPKGERAMIRWELVREEDGTLLKLTHKHLTRRTSHGFAPGMHAFLDRLEAQLNGAPLPDWMEEVENNRRMYALSFKLSLSQGNPADDPEHLTKD